MPDVFTVFLNKDDETMSFFFLPFPIPLPPPALPRPSRSLPVAGLSLRFQDFKVAGKYNK